MVDNKKIMSENIQFYLAKNNMSRLDLSKRLGVTYSAVNEWIRAVKYPRIDKIEMMANIFGIEKIDLVESKEEQSTSREMALLYKAYTEAPEGIQEAVRKLLGMQ